MTLRQALSRQWQIPLFILSLICLALVLLQLRPKAAPLGFDDYYGALAALAEEGRYDEFYLAAEALRQQTKSEEELGRVHWLAARTRAKQLKQHHALGVEGAVQRAPAEEYRRLIADYTAGISQGQKADAEAYRDLALASWGLGEADRALQAMERALAAAEGFWPSAVREQVMMYLAARPAGYLDRSLEELEKLLTQSESSADDRGWAFVRKAEVLLGKGQEEEALALLEGAEEGLRQSRYGEEIEFWRGRALRQGGRYDQAELILRQLLSKTGDRGDIFAQTALELGRINHDQFRDYDARQFYERVADTQRGKDWYAAGVLGLAECAALQQRYAEAEELYREATDLLKANPQNRAVSLAQVQHSLAAVSQDLMLRREYESALRFLEIEQETTEEVDAVLRYAQALATRAEEQWSGVQAAQRATAGTAATEQEQQWLAQQQGAIGAGFNQAGEQYLRAVGQVRGDEGLYSDSLWQAATCFDKAGKVEKAIETWARFVKEREGQPEWPRAIFNLAQAYQAKEDFEQAIRHYELLHLRHPKSLAAFDAMAPLARCYLAKEPPEREKAQGLLEAVLADRTLTPEAVHFRQALFELGGLHYENQAYAEAINILTQAIDRYPDDAKLGKYLFIVGDSYRKSGLALDEALGALARDPAATVNRQRLQEQRRRYLEAAREYFNRAVDFYSGLAEGRRSEVDELYLRQCWLYRGDCLFDLGQYREAAATYELAALRYQLTPTALAAFNQIVTCHLQLGDVQEARSTRQRAMWQLREMSESAFGDRATALSRQQWQAWFEGLGQANLW